MSEAIRNAVADLRFKEKQVQQAIIDTQESCPHGTSVYKPEGSSGGWDRDPSYWFSMYCYDCGKRWTTSQDIKPQAKLRVEYIDCDEKPEVVELQIKIAEYKCQG